MTNPNIGSRLQSLTQGDCLSSFLFAIVVDVMSRMLSKAVEKDMVKGIKAGKDRIEISHLQFSMI